MPGLFVLLVVSMTINCLVYLPQTLFALGIFFRSRQPGETTFFYGDLFATKTDIEISLCYE